MIVYIPLNLDVDSLLQNHQPQTKIKSFNKEYLIYLISLPYYLPTIIRDLDDSIGVPFYSRILKRQNKYYWQYIEYLVSNKILIKTSNYSTIYNVSNYYNYTESYLNTKIKAYKLKDEKLFNKLFWNKYRKYSKKHAPLIILKTI